jgi:TrmH family RNA methyltransferase
VATPGERERITSTANPRLKAALRLRGRRERDARGLTLIDGVRETARALAGGAALREGFVLDEGAGDPDVADLLVRLAERSVPVVELGRDAFAKLAYGDRLDRVIAVAATPSHRLADLRPPSEPLVAVVEGVEKPGNVGALLRTADGAGVSAVILADPHTDLSNPNIIRASLGTVFTVPIAVAPADEVIAWLRDRDIAIVAALVDGSVEHTSADLTGPVAIALGSEAHGLTDAWRDAAAQTVRIPMLGVADSLNVSVTAAILFYEALRQRGGAAAAPR